MGASWARLGCQGRVRPGLAWNGKSDNGLKTWLAACMFELRRGILRHPSAPFGILRHPSGSFGVLRCPSVSLGILRYPSVFFGIPRYFRCHSVPFGILSLGVVPQNAGNDRRHGSQIFQKTLKNDPKIDQKMIKKSTKNGPKTGPGAAPRSILALGGSRVPPGRLLGDSWAPLGPPWSASWRL